jgi:hypothetical protein
MISTLCSQDEAVRENRNNIQNRIFCNFTLTTLHLMKSKTLLLLFLAQWFTLSGQINDHAPYLLTGSTPGVLTECTHASPLQTIRLGGAEGMEFKVLDGDGMEYFHSKAGVLAGFRAGGALGTQTVSISDRKGREVHRLNFKLDASTVVDDGDYYTGMFRMFEHGMRLFAKDGMGTTRFRGTTYHHYVYWLLDHYHTMKGMQYFEGIGHEIVDLFREAQRENGMVMSNVRRFENPSYYETAYGPEFTDRYEGDLVFVRQPSENHCEYIYALILYHGWKATGDDIYLERNIASAAAALDYSVSDELRWSARYKLLKRVYTIDSWDFQVKDPYTPDLGPGTDMMVHREKSKFGIFFGDNTGYALACDRMAELYLHLGDQAAAEKFSSRAAVIRENLNRLSWNGRFFTHFIDEDDQVVRDLGVEEKAQVSHSNMYSVNRILTHDQNVAIINTYLDLKENLPRGSPGEWYAIYPPFEKGFGKHNQKWQYMNGGIAGHAAGELAKGAYENGYEGYGTDILNRLYELGRDNRYMVAFAYTGAYPDPPDPVYTPVDLAGSANMDIKAPGRNGTTAWMAESEGNDMRNLPVGEQAFAGVDYKIADPESNQGKSVIAVSSVDPFPDHVIVPVSAQAGCIYLLHASNRVGNENVCGSIIFNYADGSSATQYIIKGKHLSSWWFPELRSDRAGIAWRGSSMKSLDVGISWAAIDNPQPEKEIEHITIQSAVDKSIYAVMGLTLSDVPHYVKPPLVSYGGPNNWAAGTAMSGLIEGLCGVQDRSFRFEKPKIAPRWSSADTDSVHVTVRYGASDGYVAYRYRHDSSLREVFMEITGSGDEALCHVLLPEGAGQVREVIVEGESVDFTIPAIGSSVYVDFQLTNLHPAGVVIRYQAELPRKII